MLMFNYSAGKLPVSFPRSVATAPAFYNYFKGGRPIDAGAIYPNGSLLFGHQVNVPRVHDLPYCNPGSTSTSSTPPFLHGASVVD